VIPTKGAEGPSAIGSALHGVNMAHRAKQAEIKQLKADRLKA